MSMHESHLYLAQHAIKRDPPQLHRGDELGAQVAERAKGGANNSAVTAADVHLKQAHPVLLSPFGACPPP